jgi:pyruvate/2-oxoglutarate/acetoin dehydrogenase E1 component
MPTVLERLNYALHHVMDTDERVYVLGEDILDPYGGAFKVSRGLSSQYPTRVMTTPISEAGIVGVAAGMALRGLRPVVEIMFGDFTGLAADQLINHASKFRWMYNDQVRVPLVVRTPMGGRRGYGPTHSQSLEKIFLSLPGLKVIASNTLGDPAALLEAAIADDDPVLFIEHKLLYTRPLLQAGQGDLLEYEVEQLPGPYPAFRLSCRDQAPRFTLATYGYNFELARAALLELLYEQEIFGEIILFTRLSPFDMAPLEASLRQTRRLMTVEEGGLSLGWGAEIAARAVEMGLEGLKVRRVAALDLPIANSRRLEEAILPSQETIKQAALELINL